MYNVAAVEEEEEAAHIFNAIISYWLDWRSHDVLSKPPPICICSHSGDESLPYSLVLWEPNPTLEGSKVCWENCPMKTQCVNIPGRKHIWSNNQNLACSPFLSWFFLSMSATSQVCYCLSSYFKNLRGEKWPILMGLLTVIPYTITLCILC